MEVPSETAAQVRLLLQARWKVINGRNQKLTLKDLHTHFSMIKNLLTNKQV